MIITFFQSRIQVTFAPKLIKSLIRRIIIKILIVELENRVVEILDHHELEREKKPDVR